MAAKQMDFTGVFPILITPFDDDENLDLASLDKVVRFMAGIGVQGVTVLGVLGEANRLCDADREQVIKAAVAAAGDMPVIAGTSHTGTRSCLELSQKAQELGASAVMIAPAKEPVPNAARIVELYQSVDAGIDIPIVLQDHPASTMVHLPPELILEIIDGVPGVACVKEEAVPTPPKLSALIKGMQGRKAPILVGLGALYGFFDLDRGADGFNTGFAFPEVLMAMVQAARTGDMDKVLSIYTHYLPLIVFEQQPGLAVRKEIYRLRGLIKSNRVRHPGATIDPATAKKLAAIIEKITEGQDITKPIRVAG